jgi:chorismate lyase / 3-hydroxybenzoate synthase
MIILPRYVAAGSEASSLATVAFSGVSGAAASLRVPMRQLGDETRVEAWSGSELVAAKRSGALQSIATSDFLLGWLSGLNGIALEKSAHDVYRQILEHIRAEGFPSLLRMWNHVGSINELQDGIERYQRFCIGRYEAFEESGYTMGADLPAASAVGMPGHDLVVYFLASRRAGAQVENPRQLAAYRYPPQYGPKSPSFSRATVFEDEARKVVFVSGTSSVVGHASAHQDDVIGQLDETIVNLDAIVGHALGRGGLANFVSLKTYIRNASDYEAVARRLEAAAPPSCSLIYLESDICRRELLLEIEGVAFQQ